MRFKTRKQEIQHSIDRIDVAIFALEEGLETADDQQARLINVKIAARKIRRAEHRKELMFMEVLAD